MTEPHCADNDLDGLRQRLRDDLPARLAAAVASYDRFAGQDAPEEAKAFAAHHAACKAALAHVDLLVKLARWAEAGGDEVAAPADDGLGRLLAEARAAMDDDGEEDE